MKQAIDLAKKISKNPKKGYDFELEDLNLHLLFAPLDDLKQSITIHNTIICFIIFAYDNDSSWLNLHQDRLDNKKDIIASLYNKPHPLLESVIANQNEVVNDIISEYLIRQTNWKWQTIMSLLDYHANMIRFANQKTSSEKTIQEKNNEGKIDTLTEELDIDKVTRTNKQKGELLEQAIEAREKADKLLLEIKKDFVHLDHAVQQDFGFQITDEKTIDIYSWSQFIRAKQAAISK